MVLVLFLDVTSYVCCPLGSARVLLAPGVVACIFLWTLTLAIVVSRSSNTEMARSISTRTRPLPQDRPSIEDGIQSLLAGITEDVDHLASMPGAWLHERRKQNTFETRPEPVFDMMAWRIIYSCAQEAWTLFPGATLTFTASGPLDHDSSDIVTVERTFDDGDSLACQGSGSNEVDLDAGIPFPVVDCSPSESSLSIQNPRESTTVMDNRHESSTTGDVAIKDLDSAQTTIPDTIREDGLTFALVASSDADRVLCQDDTSSDSDESASGNQTDGTEGEGLFGIGAQRPDISALEREDEYRALGRRQDGALSDTGCPLLLRRVRSTGYLSRRRDVFNDGDDSYWTEQVNARLSPCRYGWSEVSSWPPEGREDETDNWRIRNSQVTNSAESEKASDEHASFSDRAGRYVYTRFLYHLRRQLTWSDVTSDDGPPGIYVVPQKRGRMTGGRPRSPVSSPRTSDYPSGLGFFPFRKTPSLLTPEAWRPGCLYIPDPPVDESIQADAWWDSLSSVRTGHVFDAGTVNQDVPEEQGPSRDPHGGQVSWRDRYENDPASRRFNAVHRRAMTEG